MFNVIFLFDQKEDNSQGSGRANFSFFGNVKGKGVRAVENDRITSKNGSAT